jgi:hypothetical protein
LPVVVSTARRSLRVNSATLIASRAGSSTVEALIARRGAGCEGVEQSPADAPAPTRELRDAPVANVTRSRSRHEASGKRQAASGKRQRQRQARETRRATSKGERRQRDTLLARCVNVRELVFAFGVTRAKTCTSTFADSHFTSQSLCAPSDEKDEP